MRVFFSKRLRGFTLIELLVVIAIIATVKTYLCPSDRHNQPAQTWGGGWVVGNYVANAQVFPMNDGGWGGQATGNPDLAASFPDGTSTTCLFAEHYARCQGQGKLW